MPEKEQPSSFQLAVSDKDQAKLGVGGTAKTVDRQLYYFAERTEDGAIYVQPLNANFVPAGQKTVLEPEKFLERFKPEPLFFYNRVKPAMDSLKQAMDKAEKHLAENKLDRAEKDFKQALAVDGENIKAIFGLGITYLAGGKLEEAGEVFKNIMALDLAFDAEHTHLFNEFGIKMRKAGMLDKALEYYQKALRLNQRDEHLHFNVARIHYDAKDYAKAVESLKAALAIAPGFVEAARMLKAVEKLQEKSEGT
ncbi:MAG: tetratricopeptide repeat protein [Thermodesulfobacteriota bacterium]